MSSESLPPAVVVQNVSHRYKERQALSDVSFTVAPGEVFGLLGPNGGGKTTLFRLLCTILPLQAGEVSLFGHDLAQEADAVRRTIGVTFQSPSVDPKLTVGENLTHQGHLYGLTGAMLKEQIRRVLEQLNLSDRAGDRCETLSGGLKRRVEIAKAILHTPRVVILDEPSTGLDVSARLDMWKVFAGLRSQGVTILVTTHLMEEAERCDRLGILDQGRLVALGTPDELRTRIGGDCLTIPLAPGDDGQSLAGEIAARFSVAPKVIGHTLRIESTQGSDLLRELVLAFPDQIRSITLGKPSLEDVFVHVTGRRFETETPAPAAKPGHRGR
jgi:ABC-2 type transport system ATP-binding protein